MDGQNGTLRSGFTLVELLVVIAIVALLATVGVIALNRAREKAYDAKRLSDARQIANAMQLYFENNGKFPDTNPAAPGYPGYSYGTYTAGGVKPWSELETLLGVKLPRPPTQADYYSYFTHFPAHSSNTCGNLTLFRMSPWPDAATRRRDCNDAQTDTFVWVFRP